MFKFFKSPSFRPKVFNNWLKLFSLEPYRAWKINFEHFIAIAQLKSSLKECKGDDNLGEGFSCIKVAIHGS